MPETLALAPAVRAALDGLDRALFRTPAFSPGSGRGALTLAMSDYWYGRLIPPLMEQLEREAPGIHLRTVATGEEVLTESLPDGQVDGAIFLHPRIHAGLRAEVLLTDGYAVVVRRGHALTATNMSVQAVAKLRQVVILPEGPWADRWADACHREGVTPEIVLRTSQTRVALEVIARTNGVAVVARRVAEQLRAEFPIRLLPLPIPTQTFSLALYWHERTERDPLRSWFRALVVRLVRQLYPSAPSLAAPSRDALRRGRKAGSRPKL